MAKRPLNPDSSSAANRLRLTPYAGNGKYEGGPAIAVAIHLALSGGMGDDSACLASGRSVDFIKSFALNDVTPAGIEAARDASDLSGFNNLFSDIESLVGLPVAIEETELGFVFLHYGPAAVQAIKAANELADLEAEAGL